MNDSERRDLEQFAAEHVADGIVRYGAAGMSEGERRSFVEKLAREAIDEAARSMVEGAVTTPTAEEEERLEVFRDFVNSLDVDLPGYGGGGETGPPPEES